MTEYEKSLTIGMTTFFFIILMGAFFGSIVLIAPILIVWFSAIKSTTGLLYIVFAFLFGSWRMYHEFMRMRKISNTKSLPMSLSKGNIFGFLMNILIWSLLVFFAYISGNQDALLDLVFVMMVGGTGILIILTMMFAGTFIGRVVSSN